MLGLGTEAGQTLPHTMANTGFRDHVRIKSDTTVCRGPGPQKLLFAWGRSEDYWLRKPTLTRLTSKAHSPCTAWLNAQSSFVQSRQVHCQLCFCRKKHGSQRSPSWKVPECTWSQLHLTPLGPSASAMPFIWTAPDLHRDVFDQCFWPLLKHVGGKKLLTHQPLVGGSNSQSFHSHPWSCPAFVQFIGSTTALQIRACPWRGAHVRPMPGSATM